MRTTSKQLAFIALFGEALRRRVALPPYWRQQREGVYVEPTHPTPGSLPSGERLTPLQPRAPQAALAESVFSSLYDD